MPEPTLGIAILTRDRPTVLAKTLAHHVATIPWLDKCPIYVYDNGEKESAVDVVKQYPNVKYKKQEKFISYDEHFKYALENTPTDYVWVISDRILINIGTIPFVMDYLNRLKVCAVIVGYGGRISTLSNVYQEPDKVNCFKTVGWHTTLCGSTIYSKELIGKTDFDKYLNGQYIHFATLWDGATRCADPFLVICHGLCSGIDDYWPKWLPQHAKIWTHDLLKIVEKLPAYYPDYAKERIVWQNGFAGALLSKENFFFTAAHGCFTVPVLDKYWPYIKRVTTLKYDELKEIAESTKAVFDGQKDILGNPLSD